MAAHIPIASDSGGHFVSTDPGLLDLDVVCALLSTTYWAKDRPRPVIEASIKNSIAFGLYERESGRQVGFARVVTDGVTFSWICDVIVAESEQGRGLGTFLMACVASHPVVAATRSILATRDAHGLYEKFGFTRAEMMRRAAGACTPPSP